MERLLVLELRHLHVHHRVHVAAEVRREHVAVGRELDAGDRLVAVELSAGALRADGAGEKTHLHAVPGLGLAGHVGAVGTRPEVHAQHAHRRVRVEELVAPLRGEADAAHDVEPAVHHVSEALVVVAVDVVDVPVGVADDRLHPHLERAGAVAVRRRLEEVAAAVRGYAHALLRLRDAEELLAPFVVLVDVRDVALAVGLGELLQELRLPLVDREVDVARADRHHLHDTLRPLAERSVEEERVDLAVVQRLHGADARRYLDVGRRKTRVLEVPGAVVVGYLALRHRRVADAHPRPLGDLGGHELHRARWRRIEGEMHTPERLLGEVEVLQQLLRAERGADDVRVGDVGQVVVTEPDVLGLDAGGLEHVVHYRHAEVVVGGSPEVELGVALAVRHLHRLGRGRERRKQRKDKTCRPRSHRSSIVLD